MINIFSYHVSCHVLLTWHMFECKNMCKLDLLWYYWSMQEK